MYHLSCIIYLLFTVFLPAAVFAQGQPTVPFNADTDLPTGVGLPFTDIETQQIQFREPQPRVGIPGLGFGEIKRDGDYIYVPFLGEYIAAIYRFAVAAAAIIAVLVIIFSGFQWTASGGSQDAIGAAKKRIVGAVTGLVLAVGSYTILYAVNPELVQFRSLRIKYVQSQSYAEFLAESPLDSDADFAAASIQRPTWNAESFDCDKKDTKASAGVADAKTLITYTCPVGVFGPITSIPQMKPALCTVGEKLNAQGFGIVVTDSYRTFREQVELWCGRGAREYPNTEERKKAYAVPGFSAHGSGIAVDAHLTDISGNRLRTGVNARNQCGVPAAEIKTLAQAFYDADNHFYRYTREIWHFEYLKDGTKPTNRHQRSSATNENTAAIQCPGAI